MVLSLLHLFRGSPPQTPAKGGGQNGKKIKKLNPLPPGRKNPRPRFCCLGASPAAATGCCCRKAAKNGNDGLPGRPQPLLPRPSPTGKERWWWPWEPWRAPRGSWAIQARSSPAATGGTGGGTGDVLPPSSRGWWATCLAYRHGSVGDGSTRGPWPRALVERWRRFGVPTPPAGGTTGTGATGAGLGLGDCAPLPLGRDTVSDSDRRKRRMLSKGTGKTGSTEAAPPYPASGGDLYRMPPPPASGGDGGTGRTPSATVRVSPRPPFHTQGSNKTG